MRVLAEFRRDNAHSVNGFPQANMFDQPEFEDAVAHQPQASSARNASR